MTSIQRRIRWRALKRKAVRVGIWILAIYFAIAALGARDVTPLVLSVNLLILDEIMCCRPL